MKQTITKSMFRDAFRAAGRNKNFTYEGLGEPYGYFESVDENYDLDVIAICCDFTESTVTDALEEHGLTNIDELSDKTLVLHLEENKIVYQVF